MQPKKIPIWLDCDPGHDDAIAIILASYDPHIELLGISTVCGNQTVEKITLNVLKTLELAGIEGIEVVKGSDEGYADHQELVQRFMEVQV
jgi:uridine nucleosidase